MNIVENADRIAERAHASIGQVRKWSEGGITPYIVHPRRVAAKVKTLKGATDVDIAAALQHDVIEDVAIKLNQVREYSEEIGRECGQDVLNLVLELTNPTEGPEWEGRSRAEKRAADWEHLAQVSDRAKRIKMCDLLDNLSDYKQAPHRYMVQKYLPESRHLLGMCRYVDEQLGKELEDLIEEAENYFRRR